MHMLPCERDSCLYDCMAVIVEMQTHVNSFCLERCNPHSSLDNQAENTKTDMHTLQYEKSISIPKTHATLFSALCHMFVKHHFMFRLWFRGRGKKICSLPSPFPCSSTLCNINTYNKHQGKCLFFKRWKKRGKLTSHSAAPYNRSSYCIVAFEPMRQLLLLTCHCDALQSFNAHNHKGAFSVFIISYAAQQTFHTPYEKPKGLFCQHLGCNWCRRNKENRAGGKASKRASIPL